MRLQVGGQEMRYFAVAGILAVTSILFVVFIKEARLDPSRLDAFRLGEFVKSFWISPREYPDFFWVWITRFLVVLGNAVVTTYLLFFARDVLGLPPSEADQTVAATLIYYIGALLVCALVRIPL
jgi:Na+/melibiose symporter-like transporter